MGGDFKVTITPMKNHSIAEILARDSSVRNCHKSSFFKVSKVVIAEKDPRIGFNEHGGRGDFRDHSRLYEQMKEPAKLPAGSFKLADPSTVRFVFPEDMLVHDGTIPG